MTIEAQLRSDHGDTCNHGEGLSGAELREQGNAKMRQEDWVLAVVDYSAALRRRGADLERAEPHKVLANRSLAHLHLARSFHEMEVTDGPPVDITDQVDPVPDLMEAIGTCDMREAIEEGKLPMSQSFRVMAFADACRAVKLATGWAKAHARFAEAAYEIGIAAKRARDGHGVAVMLVMSKGAFAHAHTLSDDRNLAMAYLKRSCEVEDEIDEIGFQCAGGSPDDVEIGSIVRSLIYDTEGVHPETRRVLEAEVLGRSPFISP